MQALVNTIEALSQIQIDSDRIETLQPLVAYIRAGRKTDQPIHLNFICTHNSRRSHLAQIWAKTMAWHFGIKNVQCYSGGTEATALFPMVAETLQNQGFELFKLSEGNNPVYAIKHSLDAPASICFSKKYNHRFNPATNFAAILTCDSADEACPLVMGAAARIPIKYHDPKAFDGTVEMANKYAEKSVEIAREMYEVFEQVAKALEN